LQESIRAGDIFQAVLAERFECETEASAIDIFAQLYRINSAAYSFFFPFSQGEFMGASPEALLKVCQGRALTHPIAGTKPRGKTAIEDRALAKSLRASRKESAEHLMLVDLARNDLGRVAKPGSVRVNFYRSLQKLANVMHLVSEVEAELEPRQTPLRALASCFPAGTLSGAPKIRAMQLLAGLEREGRGLYGGAAIALDPLASRLESCIAIRCIEKRGRLAILRAGAGIVADSKARSEYDEISHKLLSARQALAAAERARARRSKA
jgi:anthranilate synthase component 1